MQGDRQTVMEAVSRDGYVLRFATAEIALRQVLQSDLWHGRSQYRRCGP